MDNDFVNQAADKFLRQVNIVNNTSHYVCYSCHEMSFRDRDFLIRLRWQPFTIFADIDTHVWTSFFEHCFTLISMVCI